MADSPPEKVWIYALACPDDGVIRYIGKSCDPKARLRTHLSEKSLKARNAKNAWLRSLLERGRRPHLIILQEITNGAWAEAERGWIVLFRMNGTPILNTSDGGEGVLETTPETYSAPRPRFEAPRRGGSIPRRPRAGGPPPPEGPSPPRIPRKGEQRKPYDKHGIDKPHVPKPPRRRKGKKNEK